MAFHALRPASPSVNSVAFRKFGSSHVSTSSPTPVSSHEPAWREFARAPLVPVAVAASIGLLVERYTTPPVLLWVISALGGIVAWIVAFSRRSASAAFWLCVAGGGLAGFYLHDHCTNF